MKKFKQACAAVILCAMAFGCVGCVSGGVGAGVSVGHSGNQPPARTGVGSVPHIDQQLTAEVASIRF